MRMHTRILAFATAFVFAMAFLAAPMAAGAQSPSTPAAGTNAGLQQAVNRNYANSAIAPIFNEAVSGTPVATPGMMEASPAASPASMGGLQTASGFVFQYSTADQATADFKSGSDQIIKSFNDAFSKQTGITIKPTSIEGVGDAAKAWTGSGNVGVTLHVFAIVAQKDNYMYFTALVSKESNVQDVAVKFTNALIDNKAGEGKGEFKKDGTSSGGLWDKFPKTGDEVLQGVKAVDDMQVYP
ncbi:MAG: hypothetical protein ACR2OE_01290 [Thermomicrobiales bacterium]